MPCLLMLQLRTCRDGQLSNHTVPGQAPPGGCIPVFVPILSPGTDEKLFHPAGDVLWVFVEPGNVEP